MAIPIAHDYKTGIKIVNKALEIYEGLPNTHRDIIVKWGKIIKKYGEGITEIPTGQVVPLTIGTPVGIFSYLFDPEKIKAYDENQDHKPIRLETQSLLKLTGSDISQFPETCFELPLCVIETPLLLQPAVLSGHDRVFNYKARGKRYIHAQVLVESEFIPLMYNDFSKAIYYFHRDLQILSASPVIFPNKNLFYFIKDELF